MLTVKIGDLLEEDLVSIFLCLLVLSFLSMPSHIYPHPLSLQMSYAHTQGRQSSTNHGVALLKAQLLSSGLGSQCSELQMTKILFLSHSDCLDFVMKA